METLNTYDLDIAMGIRGVLKDRNIAKLTQEEIQELNSASVEILNLLSKIDKIVYNVRKRK